jgi:hypothetical protein
VDDVSVVAPPAGSDVWRADWLPGFGVSPAASYFRIFTALSGVRSS